LKSLFTRKSAVVSPGRPLTSPWPPSTATRPFWEKERFRLHPVGPERHQERRPGAGNQGRGL